MCNQGTNTAGGPDGSSVHATYNRVTARVPTALLVSMLTACVAWLAARQLSSSDVCDPDNGALALATQVIKNPLRAADVGRGERWESV